MSNTDITRCPHCDQDQGTREAFKDHMAGGCENETRFERASRLFDDVGTPLLLILFGVYELFLGDPTLAFVCIVLAVLWVRQND